MLFKHKNLIESFLAAVHGIRKVVVEEKNARRILAISVIVISAGFIFNVSPIEFIIIIICCGCVFVAEIFNTLFENTFDIIRPSHCDTIKILKDMSSGAVLFASFVSMIIGLIIFIPRILSLCTVQ